MHKQGEFTVNISNTSERIRGSLLGVTIVLKKGELIGGFQFYLVFSTINRKFVLAPIPPGVNLGLTLGMIATTSPSNLFKNCSNLLWSFDMSMSNL